MKAVSARIRRARGRLLRLLDASTRHVAVQRQSCVNTPPAEISGDIGKTSERS